MTHFDTYCWLHKQTRWFWQLSILHSFFLFLSLATLFCLVNWSQYCSWLNVCLSLNVRMKPRCLSLFLSLSLPFLLCLSLSFSLDCAQLKLPCLNHKCLSRRSLASLGQSVEIKGHVCFLWGNALTFLRAAVRSMTGMANGASRSLELELSISPQMSCLRLGLWISSSAGRSWIYINSPAFIYMP